MARWPLWVLVLGAVFLWQHHERVAREWRLLTRENVVTPAHGRHLYAASDCRDCAFVAALLQQAGVAFDWHDVEKDAAAQAVVDQHGGVLPLLIDGERQLAGLDPELLQAWYVERADNRARFVAAGVHAGDAGHEPVLFGTAWCPYCRAARDYFREHGVAFRDLDIEQDADARRQYEALGLAGQGVPVILFDDMIWYGFDASVMDARRAWVSVR